MQNFDEDGDFKSTLSFAFSLNASLNKMVFISTKLKCFGCLIKKRQ